MPTTCGVPGSQCPSKSKPNVCFFSGRLPTDNPPGTGKQYDIMDIEPERRYGYSWGGSYGARLLTYAASVGYYP